MELSQAFVRAAKRLGRRVTGLPRNEIGLFSFVLVLAIGFADYCAGKDVTLSIIYVFPIWLAAWYVGPAFAFGLAVLSVALWIFGDLAAGMTFTSFLVPVWNASIRLVFYVFLIVLLQRLNSLQKDLGKRVEERAAALTREIAEREQLERDLLEVSEREQRRIGQDLHDGLCQHLTGTALASHVLAETLASNRRFEAAESRRIVGHIEDAIVMARGMAKGLHPVEMDADGLMQALDEFASTTSEMFGISCRFECDSPVLVRAPATATNLYRIAQEAVSNAIKHGRANEIAISLENSESGIKLTIADNGCGIPDPLPPNQGMGLRIMANRAKVIGAGLYSERGTTGGAQIACVVPAGPPILRTAHD